MVMHALLLELDSIQPYLFSSGRLRDVAGASELLDRLTHAEADDNLLDAVCRALGVEVVEGPPAGAQVAFSRRAGGAFYAFSEDRDALERLRALWTLAVQRVAPHLGYTLGSGTGEDAGAAFRAARAAMRKDTSRQRPPLPAAAPVAERSRRTGLPAVEFGKGKDGAMDAATVQRKAFSNPAGKNTAFLDRFKPDTANLKWDDWPFNLDADEEGGKGLFPFRGDARILALVHADGNGLGQILRRLNEAAKAQPDRFVSLYSDFSKLVEEVTTAAARAATAEVLLPARKEGECLPARPILLGGDDITILVRADLAMDYVRAFTRAFEAESHRELEKLAEKHDIQNLPARLTLGIGLVYLRASQPFHLAIRLAETLTRVAKQKAKERNPDDPASSLAFHRVTSTLIDDYGQLVDQTLSHRHGDDTFVDTLGAYFLGEGGEQPQLDDLLSLAGLLGAEDMARGPTRGLLTLMGHGRGEAEARYRLWRQVMKDQQPSRLKRFDALLETLAGVRSDEKLPYAAVGNREWHSPLGDALALLGAGHESRPVENTRDTKEDAA